MKVLRIQKAFTIVELLVVVAIIAILTAITTASFATSKSKARDAKRISDLNQIQLALELFFDRCNQYPVVSGTIPDINAGAGGTNGCPTGISLASFISKIPSAPNSGEIYEYGVNASSGAPIDYVLKAVLENSSSVLTDTTKLNYTTGGTPPITPGVNCSVTRAYCVQPR